MYAVLPITLEMVEGEPHTHHGLDTHMHTHRLGEWEDAACTVNYHSRDDPKLSLQRRKTEEDEELWHNAQLAYCGMQ